MTQKTLAVLLAITLLLSTACATGISQQARAQVTYSGNFSVLQERPSAHLGEVVIFGGKILETKASPTFSEITVLQLPLGSSDRPQDGDRSEGRFLLRSVQFLDPAVYRTGLLLTAVGKITGSELRPIGGLDYAYPVVDAIEIKLWPERSPIYPGIQLGVGVGSGGSSGGGAVGVGVGF
ncbi:MAG TPA: Slp family lipoprotein [Syntrophobacteria bacterium]|nr:Slp family lipoprotein [Syntrophobacteria bacterium]